mmetsp:Transcript_17848/g.26427  ORF Transcript_17848/g.26427 Transcript_17848/m.26427 type:complete len:84 (-) Transcript_17848:109-360(-)
MNSSNATPDQLILGALKRAEECLCAELNSDVESSEMSSASEQPTPTADDDDLAAAFFAKQMQSKDVTKECIQEWARLIKALAN